MQKKHLFDTVKIVFKLLVLGLVLWLTIQNNFLLVMTYIMELTGWKEVDFLGPFGGSLKLEEQKEIRENGLKLLRRGLIVLEQLTGPLYYNSFFQKKFMNRSTKNIPLASSALKHLV